MYVFMYVCMHACVYVCMFVCLHVCICVRTYVRTCARTYVCMYVRMYVRMYVCMCVCVCVRSLLAQVCHSLLTLAGYAGWGGLEHPLLQLKPLAVEGPGKGRLVVGTDGPGLSDGWYPRPG